MSGQSASTLLLDYTQDKIAVVDADGTFTYVNDAARQILGFHPDGLVGTNAFDYIHPADREQVRETFESVIDSARYSVTTGTYRHETADGDWAWLESRLSNLTNDALEGYVVSSRDVTDRVEAHERRLETEHRLQELAEQTSEVLWVFGADWEELLFCNRRCEEVYGVSTAELEANPTRFLDCIHPDDVPAVKEAMERLSDGERVDMEYRVDPDSDYTNWAWVQAQPIVEDGEVVRIVGFARDITDRRRRERQLAVMDNLLRHNLRNNMSAILTNAELIEERPDEKPAERAAVIRRVGTELIETAEKQREIIELVEDPAMTRPIDLAETVREAVDTLAERFPDASIETELGPAVTVDALEQFRLGVLELGENALRHAEVSDPTATVATRVEGDSAAVVVEDNCPPIPEHEYQVLTGEQEMTATYHSSGLGLWLVYWVVDLSGGHVEFERSETGNVATIYLPLKEA